MNLLSCNPGTLNVYVPDSNRPWNAQKAQHLYRRLAFSTNIETINSALSQNSSQVVDALLDNAVATPISTPPTWANFDNFSYWDGESFDIELLRAHYEEWLAVWIKDMFKPERAIKEKLTLFWSNHFVTVYEVYNCTPSLYQYHKLLQENAFGNFKEFVHAMGLNPAMLIYLDGESNVAEDTNENYARELFELFTLGQNNGYTQTDIEEAARALTGWKTVDCVNTFLEEIDYDNGEKTIFGRTGNWNYDDLINILFEERSTEIANFICGKLCKFYVSNDLDKDIISELADIFINSGWEIEPVLRTLFKSEYFFDDTVIGSRIKSPTEIFIGFFNETNITPNEDDYELIGQAIAYAGQQIFSPPDVAGWQENRNWIDNNSLTIRWELISYLVYLIFQEGNSGLKSFALEIVSSNNDPTIIAQEITDYLMPNGLNEVSDYNTATTVFKTTVPENYFADNTWNMTWEEAEFQTGLLLVHLFRQPEFQLT